MRKTFEAAVRSAQGDDFWGTPVDRIEPWNDFLDQFGSRP